jgi:NADH:ubiquinone oxidoreductase subunit E
LSAQTIDQINAAAARYPTRLAALLPALHLVMDEVGHITEAAMAEVADILDVPPTRVQEAATFYTMFSIEPQGRHVLKLCRNLSCQLRGAGALIERAKEVLGIDVGETTPDGRITLETDECLASCGTGPACWCRSRVVREGSVEVTEWLEERLNESSLDDLLGRLK